MSRMLLVAVLALALLLPATALGADPPPGAAISKSLEYLNRVPGPGLVEGKFDRVAGRDVLVTTGPFGFRLYDVADPEPPALLSSFHPPEGLGGMGDWQAEDRELDTSRKLIIGALDPR